MLFNKFAELPHVTLSFVIATLPHPLPPLTLICSCAEIKTQLKNSCVPVMSSPHGVNNVNDVVTSNRQFDVVKNSVIMVLFQAKGKLNFK